MNGTALSCWAYLGSFNAVSGSLQYPLLSSQTSDSPALRLSLDSCKPGWPTTKFFANNLQLSILRTDMPYGSQDQQIHIGPCRSATLVSYPTADSTVFSAPCFQPTTHPKSSACQSIMNPSSPPYQIMSPQFHLIEITTVLPESRLKMTQAIVLGDRTFFHFEIFIADTVLVQMRFRKSCFRINLLKRPQYVYYLPRLCVKTLL